MSTRRAGAHRFDHGAQYFTVKDERFGRWVRSWVDDGVVARWDGTIAVLGSPDRRSSGAPTARFVGVPGMSALCRHLARDLDVRTETSVAAIERDGGRWRVELVDDQELDRFDAVIVSAPGPQTARLLAEPAPELARRAASAEIAPSWATMVVFPESVGVDFDAAFVHGSPLSWIARNDSKPGRGVAEEWVLHGSSEWSLEFLDYEADDVAGRLVEAFWAATSAPPLEPVYLAAHRWRYALPTVPLPEPCLFDAERGLGACGDWCGGPRVEGAFLSGCAVAGRVLTLRPAALPASAPAAP